MAILVVVGGEMEPTKLASVLFVSEESKFVFLERICSCRGDKRPTGV